MLSYIVLILQAALALLYSVQTTPNLPESIKQQAVDYSYQAVETATRIISEISTPTTDEVGKILAPAVVAEIPAHPCSETYTWNGGECVCLQGQIENKGKCETADISVPRHIPTADEYPIAKFYFNGRDITTNLEINYGGQSGNAKMNLGQQFVNLNEQYTFSWNITQKDNHLLKCEGTNNAQSGSLSKSGNNNFSIKCSDDISKTYSMFYFSVIAK